MTKNRIHRQVKSEGHRPVWQQATVDRTRGGCVSEQRGAKTRQWGREETRAQDELHHEVKLDI